MRIGVTDQGEISKELVKVFKDQEVVYVPNPASVIREKPEVIVHTAEIPFWESNSDPPKAWSTNTWMAINIARAGSKIGAVNVYPSTFMVYNGKKGYYLEHNTPHPLNYYGLSKLAAETGIASLGNYLIMRVGALYSLSYEGILKSFIKASFLGRRIRCPSEMFISPISIYTFAIILEKLIKNGIKGFINVSGPRRQCWTFALRYQTYLVMTLRKLKCPI
ncbi:sugar nucleotide-binding protein [Sulfuracidifex metallicus]|uniref:sugar nucleotide-binding protein n=1 Tax=Sulfuracidifex metallicus TaxID=47303 RepID=UPI000A45E9DA|nr:sugar nucleotide-binding protein [Sulfuracidifex metallicus]